MEIASVSRKLKSWDIKRLFRKVMKTEAEEE